MVVADSLWSIGLNPDPSGYFGGAHGYDNAFSDMNTIFYAQGPAFKENYSSVPFSNVEVYGIIAEILGLEYAVDQSCQLILRTSDTSSVASKSNYFLTCIFFSF